MRFYSKLAREIVPYQAGEQPLDKSYIKLNTNENPYPPSPRIKEFLSTVNYSDLRLYPDPNLVELKKTIAESKGITTENVFVGNGSDEVLSMCYAAFFNRGETIAYADITYSFYSVYADYYGLNSKLIPLKQYQINKEDYINLDCKGIIIANPNAPTGCALDANELESIIKSNGDKIVIVDQAYIAFSNHCIINLIKQYNNLIVIETMSKSHALAGIRCGFAYANEDLIEGMKRIKNSINSYTVNRLSMQIAKIALEDKEYYNDIINKIIATRQRVYSALNNMGINVLDSQANFLFVKIKNAEEIYSTLKKQGVLVRYFGKALKDFIRVTIGRDDEMNIFLEKLESLLTKSI